MARRAGEAEFLAEYDVGAFERPSVTVDVVLLAVNGAEVFTRLVRRAEHPFREHWALPGGFVSLKETLDEAAARVLKQKAGITGVFLEQLYTFGALARDPRTRVISVSYYALVDRNRFDQAAESADAITARVVVPWQGERGGLVKLLGPDGKRLPIAFDHDDIVGMAIKRIRGKLAYAPIGFELLPKRFTLLDLQRVHEAVLGERLNKDSFRRRMLASGLLEPTGRLQEGVGHRPAELYRFDATGAE
jgi:8-oxo-dGTP diphosphatase